ncbi:hypothetical protein PMAYCL1PPCAC_10580, partial [Pristionchus mayeri]
QEWLGSSSFLLVSLLWLLWRAPKWDAHSETTPTVSTGRETGSARTRPTPRRWSRHTAHLAQTQAVVEEQRQPPLRHRKWRMLIVRNGTKIRQTYSVHLQLPIRRKTSASLHAKKKLPRPPRNALFTRKLAKKYRVRERRPRQA